MTHPLSTCFCSSTGGGPFLREGSDLFFIDLGDAYFVELLTEKGKRFLKINFLRRLDLKDLTLAKEVEKKARKSGILASHRFRSMGSRKDWTLMESPFWDRIHEKCIGCSICTFLCPTCHCFDIVDEAEETRVNG